MCRMSHGDAAATVGGVSELEPRPEPSRRLAPEAGVLWGLGALAWALPLALGAPALVAALGAPDLVVVLTIAASGLLAVPGVVVLPVLRVRRWRWEVRDEEVDLRHGAVTEIRTIVPMARVQHVDVRRSPLSKVAGTADLVLHTAAGETTIPMLREGDATDLRDRIARLARAPDDL